MRFCNRPSCRRLVVSGYCDECRRKVRASQQPRDHISSHEFAGVLPPIGYNTTAWRRRRWAFLRAHPFCLHCIAEGHPTGLATEIDHRVPHNGDRVLFWDEANWDPLCKHHHGLKTAREMIKARGSIS